MYNILKLFLISFDTGLFSGIGGCFLNLKSGFLKNFTDFTLLPNLHPLLSKFFAIMVLTGLSIVIITLGLIIFKRLSAGIPGAFDNYKKIKEPPNSGENIFRTVTDKSEENVSAVPADKSEEDYVISEEILKSPQTVKEALMLFLKVTKN